MVLKSFRQNSLGNDAKQISWKLFIHIFSTPTLHRKFDTNIPRNEAAWPRFKLPHSWICERFIYSHDRSAYFVLLRLRTHRGCRNWERGCSVSYLGIFVSNFWYSAFAVRTVTLCKLWMHMLKKQDILRNWKNKTYYLLISVKLRLNLRKVFKRTKFKPHADHEWMKFRIDKRKVFFFIVQTAKT
jgi:hypothetical protein